MRAKLKGSAGLDAYLQRRYASGAPQMLTYALSYMSPLHFEPGHVELLECQQPRHDAIQRLIPADCHDLGLIIPWRTRPARSQHLGFAPAPPSP